MAKANWLDYYRCEQIIRKSSKTFYAAFKRIPDKAMRKGVFAVYAFCRTADDLIDVRHDEQGLLNFERDLKRYILAGERSNHFMWRALQDTFTKFPSTIDSYQLMIEGQKMDLRNQSYKTLDELFGYCEAVASSVGWMLNPILATGNHEQLHECARSLGIAMQLTNILRDIGEDLLIGRCYLPTDQLAKYQISKDDLSRGIISSNFIKLFEELASIAQHHYDKAESYLHLYPSDVRQVLLVALRFYKEIIAACRAAEYDVFTRRNYVTDTRKREILASIVKGEQII